MTQWGTVSRWRGQPCSSFWRGAPWSSESTRENCRIHLYCCGDLLLPGLLALGLGQQVPLEVEVVLLGVKVGVEPGVTTSSWSHTSWVYLGSLYTLLWISTVGTSSSLLWINILDAILNFCILILFTFLSLAAKEICAMRAAISSQCSKSTQ